MGFERMIITEPRVSALATAELPPVGLGRLVRRYTKALEAIRKLKSEQTAQIKEHKLKMETLETRANQAKRLRTNVSEDSEKASLIRNSMTEDEKSSHVRKSTPTLLGNRY